jgi:hypothetical protein
MANLSKSDARLLIEAADEDSTAPFKQVMGSGNAADLKMFYMAHSDSLCGETCPMHKHLACFVGMVQRLSNSDADRLMEIMDFFQKARGTLKEKYFDTCVHFNKTAARHERREPKTDASKIMNLINEKLGRGNGGPPGIADFLKMLLQNGASVSGSNEQSSGIGIGVGPDGAEFLIMVSGNEIVIRGDVQPPESALNKLLSEQIPNFSMSNYRIRRVDSNGEPLEGEKSQPMQPGFEKVDLDSIEDKVPQGAVESFGDMMARLKAMKS